MNELDRTVRMKVPATIVDTRRIETIATAYHRKAELKREIQRLTLRGEVRPYDATPRWNRDYGQWEQRVIRLKDPAPAWRRRALIGGGVAGGVGIMGALIWWLLASLALVPLSAVCLAAAAILAWTIRVERPVNVYVSQNVTVRR